MPVKPPASLALGAVAPEDAIAAFAARKLLRPTFRWQDIWQEEHARAFAVAGVMRLDVLEIIRSEIRDALPTGVATQDFVKQLRAKLVAKGFWGDIEITDPETGELRKTRFNENRLRLIFDVNMRQSHAAGRWQRGMRSNLPFIVYRTMGDERVRASHRPWDFLVLPREHPFWDEHLPPNGWRCRCHFYFTNQAGVDALKAAGFKLKFEPPPTQWVEFVNRSTGQVTRVPRGIDPGFAYNPGKAHVPVAVDRLARGIASIAPTAPGVSDALPAARAVVARMRREKTFADFLQAPPAAEAALPVAVVPAAQAEPPVVAVAAKALRAQAAALARDGDFPLQLPTQAASWALAQAIIDRGQRLTLASGRVLWWWLRGDGENRRVLTLELQRDLLAWQTQSLATLSVPEALARYPELQPLL